MKIVKITFFLFLLFQNISIAKNKVIIIATVNNSIITNFDLEKEIHFIEIVNTSANIDKLNIKKIAKENLINDEIKYQEIKQNKNKITDEKLLNEYLNIFIKNTKINLETTNDSIKELIKKKIFIDVNWNNLINQKFAWKININMDEINKKITNDNSEESLKIKKNLINIEKQKKMKVFSNYYFNLVKNKSLIKTL